MKYLILLLFPVLLLGQNNYSLYYDGGDYLRVAVDNYRATDSQGTINVWIKPKAPAGLGVVFGSTRESATSGNWVRIRAQADSVYLIHQDNADTDDLVSSTNKIHSGAWHLLQIKSTGTAYIIKIDGGLESNIVVGGSDNGDWFADVPITRANITVGARVNTGAGNYWKGHIDEISVFSVATTDAQDAEIWNSGKPKDISGLSGLVDYWRFEEGTGTTTAPMVGALTFTFGDGSTSSTYPTWSSDTPGWDSGATITPKRKFGSYGGWGGW